MTLNNSFSFLEVGLSGGGPRARRTAGGDRAGMADPKVARVAGRRTVRAVAGGLSFPSSLASPEPLAALRRPPAPPRTPVRSEQSQ